MKRPIFLLFGTPLLASPACFLSTREQDPFFMEGQVLYWKVQQNALDYLAVKDYQVQGSGEQPGVLGTADLQGTVLEQPFDWTLGGRLMAGYHFGQTDWTLSADFTWYQVTDRGSKTRPEVPFGFITPLNNWGGNINAVPMLFSQTKIDFQYKVARANFLGTWEWSDRFFGTVGFGLIENWSSQKWKVLYFSPAPITAVNYTKWQYRGIGLNLIGSADFCLGAGFDVGVSAAQAGLYGPYKMSNNATDVTGAVLRQYAQVTTKKRMNVLWQTQLGGDLSWSYAFKMLSMKLTAGYEVNILNGINVQYQSAGSNTNGGAASLSASDSAIYLQGLNGAIAFSY